MCTATRLGSCGNRDAIKFERVGSAAVPPHRWLGRQLAANLACAGVQRD